PHVRPDDDVATRFLTARRLFAAEHVFQRERRHRSAGMLPAENEGRALGKAAILPDLQPCAEGADVRPAVRIIADLETMPRHVVGEVPAQMVTPIYSQPEEPLLLLTPERAGQADHTWFGRRGEAGA